MSSENHLKYNDFALLLEGTRRKMYRFLAECARERILLVPLETWRTVERQEHLYNIGRSQIKGKEGAHCNGRAMDVGLVCEVKKPGTVSGFEWNHHIVWDKVGEIARRCGLFWGGDWMTLKDYMHVEDREAY